MDSAAAIALLSLATLTLLAVAAAAYIWHVTYVPTRVDGDDIVYDVPADHPNALLYVLRALLRFKTSAFIDVRTIPDLPRLRVETTIIPRAPSVHSFAAAVSSSPSLTELPLTYPQALAEVLGIAALTGGSWPLPLLPFPIHVRQTIELYGPRLSTSDALCITCTPSVARAAEGAKGIEVDLVSSVVDATGALRYRGVMTGLYRAAASASASSRSSSDKRSAQVESGAAWLASAAGVTVRVGAGVGWTYARASGDYNPIHLHTVLGRALGFKGCVVHGMWTMARMLAALEEAGVLPTTPRPAPNMWMRVVVDFKRPLICPATVRIAWSPREQQRQVVRMYSEDMLQLHADMRVETW